MYNNEYAAWKALSSLRRGNDLWKGDFLNPLGGCCNTLRLIFFFEIDLMIEPHKTLFFPTHSTRNQYIHKIDISRADTE